MSNQFSVAPFVEVIPGGAVSGSIRPPGSKSVTNRALICAGFAEDESTLHGALRSEDTEVMIGALRATGVRVIESDGGRTLAVDPSTRPHQRASQDRSSMLDLFVANSGTTVRFLTAALSAHGGSYRLHGVERMHERPIGDLVDAIGAVIDGQIEAISPQACPPVVIQSEGWRGTQILVAGNVSSQYLSGLMMAAPLAAARRGEAIKILVSGELVSKPYVDMTAQVMRSFGAEVEWKDSNLPPKVSCAVEVGGTTYQGTQYAIEPDASAASYFWAAAAITGGTVTVQGLSTTAMQGDVGFCGVLEKMGCQVTYRSDSVTVTGGNLTGIDIDMNSISDTVQTLAVVALFAAGPTRVRGVAHNRFKETDRIGDLASELRKLGAQIDEHEDGLTITPPAHGDELKSATIETYHDHRMAMSLSLAGLRIENVRILDPACTNKTYPEFFADLEQLIGRPHRWA